MEKTDNPGPPPVPPETGASPSAFEPGYPRLEPVPKPPYTRSILSAMSEEPGYTDIANPRVEVSNSRSQAILSRMRCLSPSPDLAEPE